MGQFVLGFRKTDYGNVLPSPKRELTHFPDSYICAKQDDMSTYTSHISCDFAMTKCLSSSPITSLLSSLNDGAPKSMTSNQCRQPVPLASLASCYTSCPVLSSNATTKRITSCKRCITEEISETSQESSTDHHHPGASNNLLARGQKTNTAASSAIASRRGIVLPSINTQIQAVNDEDRTEETMTSPSLDALFASHTPERLFAGHQ